MSLEPTEAGGPYNITATLVEDSTSITLTNVMFGDVYFCSGQSNMFYTMDAVSDSKQMNQKSFKKGEMFVTKYIMNCFGNALLRNSFPSHKCFFKDWLFSHSQ